MTIFVRIASYRDPQLVPTIADCLDKAKWSQDLRFGLCWQHDGSESLGALSRDSRVRVVEVPHMESRGACWARSRCESLFAGEDFVLSIDSHMRFVEHWDEMLIEMMAQTGSIKPVLTTYPPAFEPDNEDSFQDGVRSMEFVHFNRSGTFAMVGATIELDRPLAAPLPARHYAAGFAFAPGRFIEQVPYDPQMYFMGEEANLGVRAFTHGFDLFHPQHNICWHYYGRKDSSRHWDDHGAWGDLERQSMGRFRRLFGLDPAGPDEDFGTFGFGRERTLHDYERYAGLSFEHQGIQAYSLECRPPPNPETYANEAEWRASLLITRRFRIVLSRAQARALKTGRHTRLTVFDAAGGEIHKHDLVPANIAALSDHDDPALDVQFLSHRPAESWAILPEDDNAENQVLRGSIDEQMKN